MRSPARRPRRPRPGRRQGAALAAAALAGLVLLGGCGGSGDSETSGSAAGGGAAEGAAAPAAGRDQAAASDQAAIPDQGAGRQRGALARVAPQPAQQLIRKADVSVRVDDVQRAVGDAKRLVSAAGGTLFAERTDRPDGDDDAQLNSQLTFKVPPREFEPVVQGLGKLGTVLASTAATEDVTDQVVDVAARIRSQRQSVDRVRALLAQAKTLGEVVQVEAELTRRVADLEALESRQQALADQVGASTVTLTLSATGTAPADEDAAGFLAGLQDGWRVFVATLTVTLTVLGAVLPFLLLVAVAWLPVRWAVRQTRARIPASPAPTPPPGQFS